MPWGNVDIIVGHTSQNQIVVLFWVANNKLRGLHLACFFLRLFCENCITLNHKIDYSSTLLIYVVMLTMYIDVNLATTTYLQYRSVGRDSLFKPMVTSVYC